MNRQAMTKQRVSPSRQRLIEMMQRMNFGKILDLRIDRGNPVIDPNLRIMVEHKFGGENGPRAQLGSADFQLKAPVLELFDLFDRLGDGLIGSLEIKNGLPFRAIVDHLVRPS